MSDHAEGEEKATLRVIEDALRARGDRVYSLRKVYQAEDGTRRYWINLGLADWSQQITGWMTLDELRTL